MTAAGRALTIAEWRPYTKGTLRGFATVVTPSGLKIVGVMIHEKNESRWVSMPSSRYEKSDGSISYVPIVEFVDRATADRFRDGVLAAYDAAGFGGRR